MGYKSVATGCLYTRMVPIRYMSRGEQPPERDCASSGIEVNVSFFCIVREKLTKGERGSAVAIFTLFFFSSNSRFTLCYSNLSSGWHVAKFYHCIICIIYFKWERFLLFLVRYFFLHLFPEYIFIIFFFFLLCLMVKFFYQKEISLILKNIILLILITGF